MEKSWCTEKSWSDKSMKKSWSDKSLDKSWSDKVVETSWNDKAMEKSWSDIAMEKSSNDKAMEKFSSDKNMEKSLSDKGIENSCNVEKQKYKRQIVWTNVFFLSLLHVMAIYGFYIRQSMVFPRGLFAKFWGIITGIGITAGAHRLWAHRSYKANTAYQILLAVMVSGTYQNSIYTWCRDHRLHHKYTETDADPHNSKRGIFFSHIGWLMVRKHPDVAKYGKTIDMSDLESNPIVMFQHKYYYIIVFVMTFMVTTFGPWLLWDETLSNSFFVLTIYRYTVSLHITWSINSFAHMFGSKPYNEKIGPTENTFTAYCSLGEGFHNYHHTFPWDYKAAELGGDIRNITTEFINFFAWIGWVTGRKSVPKSTVITKSLNCGDGTLEQTSTKPKSYADMLNRVLVTCTRYFFFGLYLHLL